MRPMRGFTMIEMLTAVAIIGILAGLSAIALTRLKSRGNFASATGDFVTGLRTARAEAFARGDNTVVIVDIANGQWWAIEDVIGNFSLGSFSSSTPAPSNPDGGAPDRLISQGTLPPGVSFGPTAGWGSALSPPLSGIPTGFLNLPDGGTANITADGGSAAPNFPYCSFCDTSSNLGAITFLASGGAQFSGGPLTIGQQLSMQDVSTDAGVPATGIIDFAIVGTTGAIQPVTIQ